MNRSAPKWSRLCGASSAVTAFRFLTEGTRGRHSMATISSAARSHNGLSVEGRPEPCVVVIFGATGDLTHRKLIPALYALAADGRLPEGTVLVGLARRPVTDEEWQADVLATCEQFGRVRPFRKDVARKLAADARYVQASFEDPSRYDE